jgi:hypothetical protein
MKKTRSKAPSAAEDVATDQAAAEAAPPPEAEPSPAPSVAPPAEVEAAAWTEGAWGGRKLYQCARCPVNTLDLRVITEHVREAHGSAIRTQHRI